MGELVKERHLRSGHGSTTPSSIGCRTEDGVQCQVVESVSCERGVAKKDVAIDTQACEDGKASKDQCNPSAAGGRSEDLEAAVGGR